MYHYHAWHVKDGNVFVLHKMPEQYDTEDEASMNASFGVTTHCDGRHCVQTAWRG